MKLLHLADLHLGKSAHGRDLVEDQRYALNQVLALARDEKPDALILAGDIFDRAVPSTDALKLFNAFIASLKEQDPGLCIAVIPGNHDSAQRLAFLSGVLSASGVHLRADPQDCDTPVILARGEGEAPRLRLWLLPFLTPGSLEARPAGGSAPGASDAGATEASKAAARERLDENEASLGELFASAALRAEPEAEAKAQTAEPPEPPEPRLLRSQEELFKEALSRIALARARLDGLSGSGTCFDVLVCHAFASGGLGSDSERVFLGAAELVDAGLFDTFDYVALGHLHRPQAAGMKGRYPGSLLQYSFADAAGERGCLVVELGGAAASAGPAANFPGPGAPEASLSARFVAIQPLRRMSRIEGSLEELLGESRFSAMEGDYLEALLRDGEGVLNPMDALRARFPWILSLRLASFEGEGSAQAATLAPGAARNVLDDFRDFYRELKGEAPDEAIEALFLALAEEVEREAD